MSLDLRVSALTAALKSDFWKAWDQVAKPAPWEDCTTIVPSSTKIENFVVSSPCPGFSRWLGARNYQQTDSQVFSVRNETHHLELMAKLEDVEDEQVALLAMQARTIAEQGKLYPGRMVFKLLGQAAGSPLALANGAVGNVNGFDNAAFFSNRTAGSGGFGIGNNSLSFTSTGSSDALRYYVAALYHDYPIKPLCWLNRSAPDFRTNAGDNQSSESRIVKWWCDLRGAPFFSYWFNACLVSILNTPNVADLHNVFQLISTNFRKFAFPKASSAEDGQFIHEQTQFGSSNLLYVGSTGLSEVLAQALEQPWVPQSIGSNTVATTNRWQGKGKWVTTNYMDYQ